MQARVKEFFNSFHKEKHKQPKRKRSGRTMGIRPYIDYSIPNITNFSHFMECEIAPSICPMMWEILDMDFENINRRFCDYCQKYIYKADNETMVQKLKDENKCMAISNSLLEKIHGKIDEARYDNLEKRLNISKLFMHFKKFNPIEFEDIHEKNLSYEEQLKEILLFVIKHKKVEKYINLEIDMEDIYQISLKNSNDEKFKQIILENINSYQEK